MNMTESKNLADMAQTPYSNYWQYYTKAMIGEGTYFYIAPTSGMILPNTGTVYITMDENQVKPFNALSVSNNTSLLDAFNKL